MSQSMIPLPRFGGYHYRTVLERTKSERSDAMSFKILLLPPDVDPSWPEKIRQAVPGAVVRAYGDPQEALSDIEDTDAVLRYRAARSLRPRQEAALNLCRPSCLATPPTPSLTDAFGVPGKTGVMPCSGCIATRVGTLMRVVSC
jgi:hypothetical protein